MAAPPTGFETDGTWTTLDHETAFLTQVAAETAATLTQAGTSGQGRPIHQVDLGTPTRGTMLIVALQHGNEPASREAALAQLRDLAYSTDPAITGYLAAHRVVYVPNVSPDGFILNQRNTAQGHNTNRDFFRLDAPETQAVQAVIKATAPHFIVDAHEYFTEGEDWWGFPGGSPATHPDIAALEQACFTNGLDVVRAAGYTAAAYPESIIPRAGLGAAAGMHHAVGMLSETNALHGDAATRVAVQRLILDMFRDWHEANADACARARIASIERARHQHTRYPLLTGMYLNDGTVTVDVAGYELAGPLPQKYVDAFGITVNGTTVSMRQDAWGVIPQLLDPASQDVRVTAARVAAEPMPLPGGEPVAYRVGAQGTTRPVTRIRHRVGGVTRDVRLPA